MKFTLDDLRKSKVGQLPENACALCSMEGQKQKSQAGRALVGQSALPKASRSRVAAGGPVIRVTLISLEHRLRDSDNPEYKPLRDAIARDFDLDDADSTIEWHYRQIAVKGAEGVLVFIETL